MTWVSTGLSWPGGHLGGMFQMLTWELGPDGYVYALTTGFQRDKGLLLQRVPADHLLDAAAWEGWGFADGAWGWGNPPTLVLPGAFGELSLRRVGDMWWLCAFDAGNDRITSSRCPVDRRPTSPPPSASRSSRAAGGARRTTSAVAWPSSTPPTSCPPPCPEEMHLAPAGHERDWPYRAMHFRARIAV